MLTVPLESYWSTLNVVKSAKVKTYAKSVNETLNLFKDVIEEYHDMQMQLDNYKDKFENQNSTSCQSCKVLQQALTAKENLIQTVASILKKLNNTKDLTIIDEIFRVIYSDSKTLTSPDNSLTPKKELHSSCEDISFNDESVSEIEGTPTGKMSPILDLKRNLTRKKKNKNISTWSTTEAKVMKLSHSTSFRTPESNSKLKQLRIVLNKPKQSEIVDLTLSPKYRLQNQQEQQMDIKKELVNDDETIIPSPISGSQQFSNLYKLLEPKKPSPIKLKRSTLKLSTKKNQQNIAPIKLDIKQEIMTQDSINLLQPMINRLKSPNKTNTQDGDETFCDIRILNNKNAGTIIKAEKNHNSNSPSKEPLIDNINATNMTIDCAIDSSMSLLQQNVVKKKAPTKIIKNEKVDTIYREATVRKKAEKIALPGWNCEKCKNFYDILYKDNIPMLKQLMDECSNHRGRHNPARPSTPPGFWDPRWDVAQDTATFNRENNA